MMRNILAVTDNGEEASGFLREAARYAAAKDAFLEVAVLTPATMTSPALAPLAGFYIPDVLLVGDDASNVAGVQEALREAGCDYEVYGFHDNVAWLAGDIERSRQIADLILIGGPEIWRSRRLRRRVLETLIRSSGTPILIIPENVEIVSFSRAVLGWKPGPEATRALHALIALVEPAAAIDVVTAGMTLPECTRELGAHHEVRRHLTRHGLKADSHWLVDDEHIEAQTLTEHAQKIGADLLAVGGFSHSKMRDIVLGSVTRDLVERSDLPTLIVG